MDRPVYIYILSDPNTGRPRYVGLTCNPKGRMSCHLSPAHADRNSARGRWVRELLSQGQRPEMTIVEECCTGTAAEAEHNWICRLLEQGEILLNSVTDGGEGNIRGRPEKQEAEKALIKPISFPPDLWNDLVSLVPKGKRSAFIQEAVRKELKKQEAALQRELARLKREQDG